MRKIAGFAVVLMMLSLVACGETDEVLHLGENFKIVDIDSEQMILTVEDMRIPPIIKGEFYLLCEDVPVIYCNYEKADDPDAVKGIEFNDLIIGDEIIVSAYEKDLESLKAEGGDKTLKITQIQLGTQRMN